MSFHHDPDQWLAQAQKENCPYCRKDEDPTQSRTLKFFKHAELCAHPQVSLKGTCYLMTREHYVELFDLSDEVLLGFMQEVQATARVLKAVTGAFKINYEIHGNTVPIFTCIFFRAILTIPLPELRLITSASSLRYTAGMNLRSSSGACRLNWRSLISNRTPLGAE